MTHLKHFESILINFDSVCALTKDCLGQYFYESLRPLIKLGPHTKNQEDQAWEKLVKKVINAKYKVKI